MLSKAYKDSETDGSNQNETTLSVTFNKKSLTLLWTSTTKKLMRLKIRKKWMKGSKKLLNQKKALIRSVKKQSNLL